MMKKGIIIFLTLILLFTGNILADTKDLEITLVYDNNPYQKKLTTSWGFSCYIKGLEKNILFDTGRDGSILLDNMDKLSINPQNIDTIILSHKHLDHIGGLNSFLEVNNKITVYAPSSFLSIEKQDVIQKGAKLIEVNDSCQICKDAYLTGELGVVLKEQSLIIKTTKGLVVITGCAHPGVVNIVEKAQNLFKEDVYLLLGGFHLSNEKPVMIKEIANKINEMGVNKVAPCHCSGDNAREIFAQVFKENFILAGVGKKFKIND